MTEARGVDPEEWSRPEHDPQVLERRTFADLGAALAQLTAEDVDTAEFDAVWKSPNPF